MIRRYGAEPTEAGSALVRSGGPSSAYRSRSGTWARWSRTVSGESGPGAWSRSRIVGDLTFKYRPTSAFWTLVSSSTVRPVRPADRSDRAAWTARFTIRLVRPTPPFAAAVAM